VQLGDGSSFLEHAHPASNAPTDSFYVHQLDSTVNSFIGELAPKVNDGASPAKPSRLEYDSGSGPGTVAGNAKIMGYEEQEPITANS
jgi:hypothetical protein